MEEEDGEGEVQASLTREVNMKEAEMKYVSSRREGGREEGREGRKRGGGYGYVCVYNQ